MRRALVPLLFLALLGGCDGDADPDAGGAIDAGPAPSDAGGGMDAGAATDAGPPMDAGGFSEAGVDHLGILSGQCGELDDELTSSTPHYFASAIDFPTAPNMGDLDLLSDGAREILVEGTVGGSSVYSEAISFEVLARCEGAVLLKSESEILYQDPMGPRTDYLADIDSIRIGVSVTRAVGFPREDPYPVSVAEALLMDKLTGVQQSTANVDAADAWAKQILHVIAYSPMHAASIMQAWDMISVDVKKDTILWVTVTDGEDAFIYDDML